VIGCEDNVFRKVFAKVFSAVSAIDLGNGLLYGVSIRYGGWLLAVPNELSSSESEIV
jgi:hypothetical protein